MKTVEITTEELLALRSRLKALNYKWVLHLQRKIVNAGKITKDESLKKVSQRKIYNIIYGSVKDNYWRSIVLKHGTELCKEFEQTIKAIKKEIKK